MLGGRSEAAMPAAVRVAAELKRRRRVILVVPNAGDGVVMEYFRLALTQGRTSKLPLSFRNTPGFQETERNCLYLFSVVMDWC